MPTISSGSGPGLVLIPGGLRRAHHYAAFAARLAGIRTVHVMDRPPGVPYTMERELEETAAVLDATGAREVFGHSLGGLVALNLARTRRLDKLVLYEAAVNLGGAIPTDFLPDLERQVAAGRDATAMATFLAGTGLAPIGPLPMPLWTAFAWIMLHTPGGRETRAMLAALPAELRAAAGSESDTDGYAAITAPTLILSGTRSPEWLLRIQVALTELIPGAAYTCSPGLDHNAPDMNAPGTVADLVRAFLTTGGARAR
ncbi:alpha/beta fold hydrolase [Actinoplanes sp. NPDC051494]|uniref:alpha/beta fold hydrolase n=1 Tax=Actinoplanes sp. NPDC051494 TaxID=3363907 RepID=UPI0037A478A0